MERRKTGKRWKSSDDNIGGLDAVGIQLTDTYGSFSGVSIKRSYGTYTNQIGTSKEVSNRAAGVAPSQGAVFQYQDRCMYEDSKDRWSYLGAGFNATIVYSSNFGNQYHGIAQTYYAHTWNKTYLTGFGFAAKGIGANFSWTTKLEGFECVDSTGKRF